MADREAVEDAAAARYFCHECSKEVAVQGTQDDMTCTECEGGFIEALASLNPDYHRITSARRRRRRLLQPQRPDSAAGVNTVSLNEALEHMYPHQMLYMVQMLLENARANRQQALDAGHHGTGEVQPGDLDGVTNVAHQDNHQQQQQEQEHQQPQQQQPQQQEDNSEDAESDSDAGGLRLELEGFDLNDDEDEWEEADEEEWGDGAAGNLLETAAEINGDANHRNLDTMADVRTARANLTFYMRELFQNLVDQNVEVRVELPDMYLGNPGDYLDSRGFEQLLQQLAENDNSRRGAPPAAKSAVDQLEMVKIEQHHIDSGIAMCAICKELLALDEPAKQLPCLHLYHQDCILPWLSSRNSCPVCRYELPTDDPDYEEQKKTSRRTESTTGENGSVVTEEDQGSDRGQNSRGSVSASEETCRDEEDSEAATGSEEGSCSEHSAAPASSSEDEASATSEEDVAPAPPAEEEDEAPAPSEEDEAPARFEEDEAPTRFEDPEAPAHSDKPEAPALAATPAPAPAPSLFKRSWLIFAVGPLVSIAGLVLLTLMERQLQMLHTGSGESNKRYWWSFL